MSEEVCLRRMELLLQINISFVDTFKPEKADTIFQDMARSSENEEIQTLALKCLKSLHEHFSSLPSDPLVTELQELALKLCCRPSLLIEV